MKTVPKTPEIEALTVAYENAKATNNRDDMKRFWNEREAAIAATGFKPARNNWCCRAGKRQAAERRAGGR